MHRPTLPPHEIHPHEVIKLWAGSRIFNDGRGSSGLGDDHHEIYWFWICRNGFDKIKNIDKGSPVVIISNRENRKGAMQFILAISAVIITLWLAATSSHPSINMPLTNLELSIVTSIFSSFIIFFAFQLRQKDIFLFENGISFTPLWNNLIPLRKRFVTPEEIRGLSLSDQLILRFGM